MCEMVSHLAGVGRGGSGNRLERECVCIHNAKLIISTEYCIPYREGEREIAHCAAGTPLPNREHITNATGSDLRLCPCTVRSQSSKRLSPEASLGRGSPSRGRT